MWLFLTFLELFLLNIRLLLASQAVPTQSQRKHKENTRLSSEIESMLSKNVRSSIEFCLKKNFLQTAAFAFDTLASLEKAYATNRIYIESL